MKNNKTLTQEKINEVIEFRKMGESWAEIMRATGVSKSSIARILRSENMVQHHKSNKQFDNRLEEKILDLRAKNLSNNQIAKELNISYETVRRYAGVQPTGNRAEYGSIVSHVTGESYVKEERKTVTRKLKLVDTKVKFEGSFYQYSASTDGHVRIHTNIGTTLDMEKDDLLCLIAELCELADWVQVNVKKDEVIRLDGKPILSQEKQLAL